MVLLLVSTMDDEGSLPRLVKESTPKDQYANLVVVSLLLVTMALSAVMLSRADTALYAAKAARRNAVGDARTLGKMA
jgi:hypothetical protein